MINYPKLLIINQLNYINFESELSQTCATHMVNPGAV